jgi:predicted dithiol-disulfide oxidoreductase (DUF899 family)
MPSRGARKVARPSSSIVTMSGDRADAARIGSTDAGSYRPLTWVHQSGQGTRGGRSLQEVRRPMTEHRVGTRDEWLRERLELMKAEKELTHLSDDLAQRRRELPWVRVDKGYVFDTETGEATLGGLFRGRSQLLVYHFMFAPDWDEGCPSCSSVADGFDETHLHLQNHDVAFTAISRAPLSKLLAYRDRMGWTFPWASSGRTDFNEDFQATFDGSRPPVDYNFGTQAELLRSDPSWGNWSGEMPGMSAFALDDGVVYHTYSAYARGFDALWPLWQWLDRTPSGRNEGDLSWLHRHDTYEASYR